MANPFPAVIDLSTLDGNTGFTINGVDANDNSGRSVALAGDVNGDGIDDILIGAYAADPGGDGGAGETYVVFGKSTPFAASLDLSTLDGTTGFRLDGIDAFDISGWSVSSAGDVNGDGIADILIAAPFAAPGGDGLAGETYVVFGKTTPFAASLDLSTLDGTTGFRLDGIDADDNSGYSVASAGDVNGDGIADILIGAYVAAPGGDINAGETYVVFGKNTPFAASLDLSTLDGITGFTINGVDAGDLSGFSVASAGDVNGDGLDDILIGAFAAAPGGDGAAGETYVVFGKSTPFAASLDLSTLDGTTGFRLDGIDADDRSGVSVASAGDVNGDGVTDLLIGAYQADPGGDNDGGETYVVFGKTTPFAASLDLSTLDGTTGFRLDGIDANDLSGWSVASAGDVNGDGIDDILIGAYLADPGGDGNAGETYVVFGKSTPFAASLDLSTLDGTTGFRLDGIDANDASGVSVASAGDVNGDGFDDLLIGAYAADPGGRGDAGETYVIYGRATIPTSGTAGNDALTINAPSLFAGVTYDGLGGTDTLNLSGSGTFDFSGTTFTNIESISGQDQTTNKALILADEGLAQFLAPGSFDGAADTITFNSFTNGFLDPAAIFTALDAGFETIQFTYTGDTATTEFNANGAGTGDDTITVTITDDNVLGGDSGYANVARTFDRMGVQTQRVATYDDGRVITLNFAADGSERMLSATFAAADGTVTTTAYDGAGRRTSTTTGPDANGNTDTITFDPASQALSARTINDGGANDQPYQTLTDTFAGGALATRAMVLDNGTSYVYGYGGYISGTGATDFIIGSTGGESVNGGAGADYMQGFGGMDTFVFAVGHGDDSIRDFDDDGADLLDLRDFGVTSRDQLDGAGAITQNRANVVIDLTSFGGDSITLVETDLAMIGNDDFVAI
ncbi:beta strand repeat-containing protein [Anianabacter salinae]|uniref:beta strand repeat-containing protein n=1 Tax=Anianabacter salinae TaxID=2851023 RepID=UPI00225E48E7|nr:integrin alpha [Anianabacter salinae]MBV0911100.1 integrin alpha [Anianabacter salinae]